MKQVIFVVLLASSFAFFGKSVYTMIRAASRGNSDTLPRVDRIWTRIWSVLVYFLLQKKVAEVGVDGPWFRSSKHHLLIFWGFLIICVGTGEMLVAGVVPSFNYGLLLPDFLYTAVRWSVDMTNFVVLFVIGYSFFRRIVLKPKLIPMSLDAGLILGAIASLMISHFLYHGLHIAEISVTTGQAVGDIAYAAGAPISSLVASWMLPIHENAAAMGSEIAFWLHVVILFAFLNYLPYSKHIHLLGALPNIFTRNLTDRRLDMPKLDLEDENQWGVGRFEQFSWKSLLDTYACTECARCTNNCPAYATDKNLSPMQLVHDIRYEMLDRDAICAQVEDLETQARAIEEAAHGHDGDKPIDLVYTEERIAELKEKLDEMPEMVGGRIAEDTLWACTTCGACQEVCPVFIEHPLKILQMRQNLVLEQEKTPGELGRMFRNIERQSNPWGISNEKRMEWAEDLGVPTVEDNPDFEYLLWVGCAGAFDNRIIKQTRSMVKVLNQAGVNYAVLGEQEGCSGDPARRAGNEMLFQMQAETNVETLNEVGAKKIIASCPHCLHTLRHDYAQFGGEYDVIHHSQLIAALLDAGRLEPQKDGINKIAYHDSCYLGRWNRIFDAPRKILQQVPIAGEIVELDRNRRRGFCCGAGGARMFVDEEPPRVNTNRTDEVIAKGVDTIAVGCPFCNIMITDGMKERDKEDDIQVLDVAELVAHRLPDK